jgi:hypothetical protein
VPCHDPITGSPTGACPATTCDQTGPAMAYRFPRCCDDFGPVNGTCVPPSQLTSSQLTSLPQDTLCPSTTWRCVPTVWLPGNTPPTCTNLIGLTGTCISRCISDNFLFGQADCPNDTYECVPCVFAPAGTPGC